MKVKMLLVAALSIVAVALAGLVTAPKASAQPMTCVQAKALAGAYYAASDSYLLRGHTEKAAMYLAYAQGLIDAAC